MKSKFAKRLGLKPEPVVQAVPSASPVLATSHPGRYPKHADPEKGQVYEGECNVTLCSRHGAVFWNIWTMGFYCTACARGINFRETICVVVNRKPTFEKMKQLSDGKRPSDLMR